MINNFLIISCTGKNNSIGLKTNNKFFKEKLQNNINSNNLLVSNILSFMNKHKVKLSNKYSIIVNMGPGSFSSLEYLYLWQKEFKLFMVLNYMALKMINYQNLKLENIENLIKNKQLENKMINPIYQ